jgi:hypothetical protein
MPSIMTKINCLKMLFMFYAVCIFLYYICSQLYIFYCIDENMIMDSGVEMDIDICSSSTEIEKQCSDIRFMMDNVKLFYERNKIYLNITWFFMVGCMVEITKNKERIMDINIWKCINFDFLMNDDDDDNALYERIKLCLYITWWHMIIWRIIDLWAYGE